MPIEQNELPQDRVHAQIQECASALLGVVQTMLGVVWPDDGEVGEGAVDLPERRVGRVEQG